ncbi:MAG: beta-glucosidase [Chloroflexi bacterium]|nr:MAG: beta-glucosidase [Chloroflexota bacterium]
MQERIEALLKQMTLEEKVSLLGGADAWHTQAVERLGIPAIKMTDGPNGARGESFNGDVTSACFPVGIALAATWNTELVQRVGAALGEETKTKGAHILLAPTVNIHRHPLGGRHFECYSEDPYLTACMAVAFIKGVQSQKVGACIKHFVCNDSEFERMSISSEVGERALREIYLTPFRMAVKEAQPWTVMAAYNKVNGTFASEHPYLLTDILKKEWGFEGFVVSDWTAVKSTVPAANAGLDLEMPGPPRFMDEKLVQAVKDGLVSEEVIDDKVRRILRIIMKSGAFEHPEEVPETSVDKPEHRHLAREAAAEAIVLLKNERNVLPLNVDEIKSLAVIGPNANVARIQGGGSARVNPHYAITPLDGILRRCGDGVKVSFEQGCTNHKMLPVLNPASLSPAEGAAFVGEFFNTLDLSGEPVLTRMDEEIDFFWFGEFSPQVNPDEFSARWTGKFTAPESGTYTFGLTSAGLSRLYVDGEEVIDNWTKQARGETYFGMGTPEVLAEVTLTAGQTYELKVEYSKRGAPLAAIRLGCLPPVVGDPMARAEKLAAESDVALVFVGLSDEWESESFDRADMELPGRQVELIEKVAAANKNTVVVLNTGSPVTMTGWIDKVAAVIEAWYPGQECGNGIADILFGDVNPSGRLPTTFPKRLEDTPAYINYPGESGKVLYGEGLFVGYRYYDKKKIEPLYPFGYGLSYTTFEYSNLTLNAAEYEPDDEIRVSVDVKNTGTRAGKEVVQLYVRDVESRLVRPEKELKAFQKVALQPGETKTVHFTLGPEALSYYDPGQKRWVAEPGVFEVLVGSSSRDIRAKASFTLKAPPPSEAVPGTGLSVDSTLREILDDPGGKAVLEKHLGDLLQAPQIDMAMGFSLTQIAPFVPDVLTPQKLKEINDDLDRL